MPQNVPPLNEAENNRMEQLLINLRHWANLQNGIQQGWVTNPQGSYQTQLSPEQQRQFAADVQAGKLMGNHPDLSATADYDFPGWWQAYMAGDPRARTQISAVDTRPHWSDTWKTPYHESFSGESIYSTGPQFAPMWQGNVQYGPQGDVTFNEPAVHAARIAGIPESIVRSQWFTTPNVAVPLGTSQVGSNDPMSLLQKIWARFGVPQSVAIPQNMPQGFQSYGLPGMLQDIMPVVKGQATGDTMKKRSNMDILREAEIRQKILQ